jgi:rfaE bifunctional protein kinase chain/domain
VKGPDYRDVQSDRTGGIMREEAAVRDVGGKLVITNDITFSSSSLLNRHFSSYPTETQQYLDSFRDRHTASDVVNYLTGCSTLKVLAIGETIIDEYQYCTAIGKSSKEPTLAVRLEAVERFPGGVLAVANHLANFSGQVCLITVTGGEAPVGEFIASALNKSVDATFFQRTGVPTLVKRRLVERYFFHKLLEIYEMEDRQPTPAEDAALKERLEAVLPSYDVVVVSDFGHGMITPAVIDTVSRGARFLAVNTQTNAGNAGYNLISKYHRADYVSITEAELRLDARDRSGDYAGLMRDAARRLGTRLLAVTRGKSGCAVFDRAGAVSVAPAVATQVVDRVGAGDAFLSVTSLCAAQGAPADVVAFIGNVVGAEAVRTVGNSKSVDRLAIIRSVESLLK